MKYKLYILFVCVLVTSLMFIGDTTQIDAQGLNEYCCTWEPDATNPPGSDNHCIVDANRENCTGAPAAGSPEQNYCGTFTDPGSCQNACNFCSYAQPTNGCSVLKPYCIATSNSDCTLRGGDLTACNVNANQDAGCCVPISQGCTTSNPICAAISNGECTSGGGVVVTNGCSVSLSQLASCCMPAPIYSPINECYRCINNSSTFQCFGPFAPEPDGSCAGFSSLYDCQQNCPPPAGTRFDRNPNEACPEACTPSTNGTYATYNDCLESCPDLTQDSCVGDSTGIAGRCLLPVMCPDPPLSMDTSSDCVIPGTGCCVDECKTYNECIGRDTGQTGFRYYVPGQCPEWSPYHWRTDLYGPLSMFCCIPSVACGGVMVTITPPQVTPRPPINPLAACPINQIHTAIGCIPVTNSTSFAAFWVRWSLGVGGGISFLMIIYAGFLYMTSGGDVEKVQEAKSYITAAVGGIFVLIFSVFILELFGLRILHLPGF